MEYQRTPFGLIDVSCIGILICISSSSRNYAYYSDGMEINSHLDGKGAGHGGGGSVVPTGSAGGISKISSRYSMVGNRIGGGACSIVV